MGDWLELTGGQCINLEHVSRVWPTAGGVYVRFVDEQPQKFTAVNDVCAILAAVQHRARLGQQAMQTREHVETHREREAS